MGQGLSSRLGSNHVRLSEVQAETGMKPINGKLADRLEALIWLKELAREHYALQRRKQWDEARADYDYFKARHDEDLQRHLELQEQLVTRIKHPFIME